MMELTMKYEHSPMTLHWYWKNKKTNKNKLEFTKQLIKSIPVIILE